mmetsp:Transcript_1596/g.5495  ORF Transcript_1596/g.5495 Transcript_1596/m.5495 type:complete len:159 (+) Transcript_1596:1025-1501(+)
MQQDSNSNTEKSLKNASESARRSNSTLSSSAGISTPGKNLVTKLYSKFQSEPRHLRVLYVATALWGAFSYLNWQYRWVSFCPFNEYVARYLPWWSASAGHVEEGNDPSPQDDVSSPHTEQSVHTAPASSDSRGSSFRVNSQWASNNKAPNKGDSIESV